MTAVKKRQSSASESPKSPAKKMRPAAVEGDESGLAPLPEEMADTPLARLQNAIAEAAKVKVEVPSMNGLVVYWQRCEIQVAKALAAETALTWLFSPRRNKDLRLNDNTALAHASAYAKQHSLPLLVLHIFSTGDYKSHHRSPRRIDFQLRQMAVLEKRLRDEYNVPLLTIEYSERKKVPTMLLEKLEEWGASALFANLEYEVDELRRDTEIVQKAAEARKSGKGWQGQATFVADFCIVQPGLLLTKVSRRRALSFDVLADERWSPFRWELARETLVSELEEAT